MIKKYLLIPILVLILTIHLPIIVPDSSVFGQTPPPPNGAWIVSDTTTISGSTIVLNGDLIIRTSGTLNLNNCELIMNCTASKSYSIYVEGQLFTGGTFNVRNSVIRSASADHPFNFFVNMSANLNMNGCTVRNLGGELNLSDPLSSFGGIQVQSSNVLIEDTNITDYASIGVMVFPFASPTIRHCNISMPFNISDLQFTAAILDSSTGLSTPNYVNNYISGNLLSGIASAGVPLGGSFATISGNEFVGNTVGIACYGTSPIITDNDFSANILSGIAVMDSDSEIWNNRLSASGSAVSILNPCTPSIHDNIINTSANGVLVMNGSDAKIYNNNISDNLIYGIRVASASPEIYENDMYGNLIGGIYLDDSDSDVHDNMLGSGALGRGMLILNDSAPTVRSNRIHGGEYALGMVLNGNKSLSPVLDRNSVHVGENGTCIDITGFKPVLMGNELYFDAGANGLNATDSAPEIKNTFFNASSGAVGAYLRTSTVLVQNSFFTACKIGINAYDCTPTIEGNQFDTIAESGVLLNKCTSPELEGNTFNGVNGNTVANHENIEMEVLNSTSVMADLAPSYLRILNSTFTAPNVGAGSKMQIDHFLDILLKRSDGSAGSGAEINIYNRSGDNRYSFNADANGRSLWNQLTQKVIYPSTIVEHSPYNVKAKLGKLIGNQSVVLDSSRTITIYLDYNKGPSKPYNITPARTHDRAPTIRWSRSIDPENDPLDYALAIGTSEWTDDIIAETDIAYEYYQLESPLAFGKYYITLTAHTADGNSSAPAQAVMEIYNTPPVLEAVGDINLYLDVEPKLQLVLKASDADTDPVDELGFGMSTDLADINLNSTTGEVTYQAVESDIGVHFINFSTSDGYDPDFEIVKITVGYLNKIPIAEAGTNITVYVGDKVYLNGSGSYDRDGTIVEYQWSTESPFNLEEANTVRPWFKANITGNFSFVLKIRDENDTYSMPDTVWVEILPEELKPKHNMPKLVLKDAKVEPIKGELADKFVFTVTITGVNISDELMELVSSDTAPLIQLKLDGKITLDAARNGPAADLDSGITYSVEMQGTFLGVGEHSFRFICNYDNVEGDLGTKTGPVVVKDMGTEKETLFDSYLLLLLFVIVLIIVIVLIYIFWKRSKRAKEALEIPPPPPPPRPLPPPPVPPPPGDTADRTGAGLDEDEEQGSEDLGYDAVGGRRPDGVAWEEQEE